MDRFFNWRRNATVEEAAQAVLSRGYKLQSMSTYMWMVAHDASCDYMMFTDVIENSVLTPTEDYLFNTWLKNKNLFGGTYPDDMCSIWIDSSSVTIIDEITAEYVIRRGTPIRIVSCDGGSTYHYGTSAGGFPPIARKFQVFSDNHIYHDGENICPPGFVFDEDRCLCVMKDACTEFNDRQVPEEPEQIICDRIGNVFTSSSEWQPTGTMSFAMGQERSTTTSPDLFEDSSFTFDEIISMIHSYKRYGIDNYGEKAFFLQTGKDVELPFSPGSPKTEFSTIEDAEKYGWVKIEPNTDWNDYSPPSIPPKEYFGSYEGLNAAALRTYLLPVSKNWTNPDGDYVFTYNVSNMEIMRLKYGRTQYSYPELPGTAPEFMIIDNAKLDPGYYYGDWSISWDSRTIKVGGQWMPATRIVRPSYLIGDVYIYSCPCYLTGYDSEHKRILVDAGSDTEPCQCNEECENVDADKCDVLCKKCVASLSLCETRPALKTHRCYYPDSPFEFISSIGSQDMCCLEKEQHHVLIESYDENGTLIATQLINACTGEIE
jgi:hypothetical protein